MIRLGYDPRVDRWVWEKDPETGRQRRKTVKVWQKPDAQLSIRMLEAWHRRYRPHSAVDISIGGVLRIPREDEKSTTIEHQADSEDRRI
jgi:hypothetical protein